MWANTVGIYVLVHWILSANKGILIVPSLTCEVMLCTLCFILTHPGPEAMCVHSK